MVSPARRRVLLVEDDPDQFDAIAFALDAAGYLVEHARDGNEALAVLQRFQPDVIVTDLVMPGMSGDEFIRAVRKRSGPQPRVLVVSGLEGLNTRYAALGADAFLRKPFDVDELLVAVAGEPSGASEAGGA